jgi:hypothetical protein
VVECAYGDCEGVLVRVRRQRFMVYTGGKLDRYVWDWCKWGLVATYRGEDYYGWEPCKRARRVF